MRMSNVLFIVGVLALILGLALAGFGIPVSEFSFGNTLIAAGATTATGGLIVIGLGAVVAQLQRLNDALAAPPMPAHQHEPFDAAAVAQTAEPQPFEPRGPSAPPEFPSPSPAPLLRNPDEPVEVADEVSLSPQAAAAEPIDEEPRDEPRVAPSWMRSRPAPEPAKEERQRSSFFDSMWPPENKMFGRTDEESVAAASAERAAPVAEPEPEPERAEAAPAEPATTPEEAPRPRAIAILKSGVVDGMSYTLYVDGSIEAELPQGTLRFASIHELRAHLEQNG